MLFAGTDEIFTGRYAFRGLYDVMHSRFREAVAAGGEGNRTLAKEKPAAFGKLPAMRPAGETRAGGFLKFCPARDRLPPVEKLVKSIENPRKVNEDLVNAQQARRVLDRLVGYELSPVLWKKVMPSFSHIILPAMRPHSMKS